MLLVLMLSLWEINAQKNKFASLMHNTLNTCASLIKDHVKQYNSEIQKIIFSIESTDSKDVASYLSKNISLLPQDFFYILDSNGRVKYVSKDTYSSFIGIDFSGIDYIKERYPLSKVHQSIFHLRPVVSLLFLLPKDELLVIEKDLQDTIFLLDHFVPSELLAGAEIFVLSDTGIVVYHPNKALMKSRHNLGFEIKDKSRPDNRGLVTYTYQNNKYLALVKQLDYPHGWLIYYSIPYKGVLLLLTKEVLKVALLLGLFFIPLWFVLNSVALKRLTRPLKEISDFLLRFNPLKDTSPMPQKLSKGILELAQIIDATNKMADNIRQANRQILQKEELFRTVTEFATDWVYWIDKDGRFLYVSPACMSITGYKPEDFYQSPDLINSIVYEEDRALFTDHIHEALKDGQPIPIEFRIISKDGQIKWIRHVCKSIYNEEGRFLGVRGSNADITHHKALEEQLLHSQKMESLGVFAGGIAHDFNNILTVIMGYSNVAQIQVPQDSPIKRYLNEIENAARRASKLTQDLLSFSKRQIIKLAVVDINHIVTNMEGMFSRIIGEDIDLKVNLHHRELFIKADVHHIEQVLMNLVTNARDAMPNGGHLLIETDLVELSQEYANTHLLENAGFYAMLSVADTGHGMDEATRQRIFDPFFTTKLAEKGTGLGLAIVYGIIKQHGGHINCYSEPNKGSTFKIYLPIVEKVELAKEVTVEKEVTGGSERILLAEDDDSVRGFIKQLLEQYGYKIIEASNGEEAVRAYRDTREPIDLFITDVIMPKLNGKEAYEEIKKLRPDLKVLFMSGYTANIIHKKGILDESLEFIMKPIVPAELLKKIRQILDR